MCHKDDNISSHSQRSSLIKTYTQYVQMSNEYEYLSYFSKIIRHSEVIVIRKPGKDIRSNYIPMNF